MSHQQQDEKPEQSTNTQDFNPPETPAEEPSIPRTRQPRGRRPAVEQEPSGPVLILFMLIALVLVAACAANPKPQSCSKGQESTAREKCEPEAQLYFPELETPAPLTEGTATPAPPSRTTPANTPTGTPTVEPTAEPTVHLTPEPERPTPEPATPKPERPTPEPATPKPERPTPEPATPEPPVATPAKKDIEPVEHVEDLRGFDFGMTLHQLHPQVYQTLLNTPWVKDGVNPSERDDLETLVNLGANYNADFQLVLRKPWFQDGLDQDEMRSTSALFSIAFDDPERTDRMAQMPFLDTVEKHDVNALYVLDHLSYARPDRFRQILDHPGYRNAIQDADARIIAVMDAPATHNPQVLNALLYTERISLERKTIQLPHTGAVDLAIIRPHLPPSRNASNHPTKAMELLTHSVRTAESLTGAELPLSYLPLLFANATPGGSSGSNHIVHLTVQPKFDPGPESTTLASWIIAHEVAHSYWNGNKSWLDEGLAEFYAGIATGFDSSGKTCPNGVYIQDLGDSPTDCHYALSHNLFRDFYLALGEEEFKKAVNRLYTRSQTRDPELDYQYPDLGISHVAEVFEQEQSGKRQKEIREIFLHWYGPPPGE